MARIANWEIAIRANTRELSRAIKEVSNVGQAVAAAAKEMQSLGEAINKSLQKPVKQYQQIGVAAQKSAKVTSSAAKASTAEEIKRQKALAASKEQFFNFGAAVLRSGTKNVKVLGDVSASFLRLDKELTKGTLSAQQFADVTIKWKENLGRVKREQAAVVANTRKMASALKAATAAEVRQNNSIEAARQQLLNFISTLRKSGNLQEQVTSGSLKTLILGFKQFERELSKSDVGIKKFNATTNTWKRQLGDAKRKQSELTATIKKSERTTSGLNTRITELSKSIQIALGPLSGFAARLTAFSGLVKEGTLLLGAFITSTILFGVVLIKSIRAAEEFEVNMQKIRGALKATGREVDFTSQSLNKFAVQLGEKTLGSANGFRKAIALLLTFVKLTIPQVRELTKVAQDLASAGFGDIESISRRLGRIFEEPQQNIEILRRFGVVFNLIEKQTIEDFIRVGKRTEVFNTILKRLQERVGGLAKGETKSLAGALDTLGERTTAFFEKAGTGSGTLAKLTQTIITLSDDLDRFTNGEKFATDTSEGLRLAINILSSTVLFLIKNLKLLVEILIALAIRTILAKVIPAIFNLEGAFVALTARIKTTTVVLRAFKTVLTFSNLLSALAVILTFGAAFLLFKKNAKEASTQVNSLTNTLDKETNSIFDNNGALKENTAEIIKNNKAKVDAQAKVLSIDIGKQQLTNTIKNLEDVRSVLVKQVSKIGGEFASQDVFKKINDLNKKLKIAKTQLKSLNEGIIPKGFQLPIINSVKSIDAILNSGEKLSDKLRASLLVLRAGFVKVLGQSKLAANTIKKIQENLVKDTANNFKNLADQFIPGASKLEKFRKGLLDLKRIEELLADPKKNGLDVVKLATELGLAFDKTGTSAQQAASALAVLRANAATLQQNINPLVQQTIDAFKGFVEDLNSGLGTAFAELFGGKPKSAVKDFVKFVKNSFIRLFAQLATFALARPIIIPIAATVGGALGLTSSTIANTIGGVLGFTPQQIQSSGLLKTVGASAAGAKLASGTGLASIGGAINKFGAGIGLGGSASTTINQLGIPSLGIAPTTTVIPAAIPTTGIFGTTATTTQLLGGGAIGALGGNLLSGLIGLNKTGGTIGGGIGGAIGTAIAPGIGTAIGSAIGSLLGGTLGKLFSASPKVQFKTSKTGTDFEKGIIAQSPFGFVGLDTATKKQSEDAIRNLTDKIASLDKSVAEFLSPTQIKTVSTLLQTTPGIQIKPGKSVDATDLFALFKDRLGLIVDAVAGKGTAAKAFAGIGPNNPDLLGQIVEKILSFSKTLREFFNPEDLSQAEKAIKDINDQFDKLVQVSDQFGFGGAALNKARDIALKNLTLGFDKSIQQQLLAIVDPLQSALTALDETQATRLKDAKALGADLVSVEKLNQLERLKVVEDFAGKTTDTLRQLLNDLLTGADSPLAPQVTLQNAQARFQAFADAVNGGNTAAKGGLADAAKELLDVSRTAFGSSEAFFRTFQLVVSTLQGILGDTSGVTGLSSLPLLTLNSPAKGSFGSDVGGSLTDVTMAVTIGSNDIVNNLKTINDEIMGLREDFKSLSGDVSLNTALPDVTVTDGSTPGTQLTPGTGRPGEIGFNFRAFGF